MSTDLQIKDVAAASGFTAATVRYYEQIGLLPTPRRTLAGYRTYDHRTVERLAFIGRAKQLGCTLDEIHGLIAAWDGGRCGPIQDRLRQLVAAKITAAQAQIEELMTFTSELKAAASALEQHRPVGACDDQCGCVSDTADAKPVDGEVTLACTLGAGSINGRLADWHALLEHVERRESLDGGVRCVFAASVPMSPLIALVAAEQDCCRFFEFSITVDRRGIGLEVRVPADALPIVSTLFGTAP